VAQGHDGRRCHSSGYARITPVSAGRLNQGGKGHTEGCPKQLTVRQSSPWHWTGCERDGGRRTGGGRRRAVAGLSARVCRARERASKSGRGRKWARGGGQAGHGVQKGRGGSDVAGERVDVGASTTGDRGREVRDSWQVGTVRQIEREGAGARERNSADSSAPWCSERERERGEESASAQGCADRRDPPVRQRGHAGWAKWVALGRISFSFFLEFLIAFLFFSLGFSIQIKFRIETKSNMCNISKNI
jgi:hypothetical protein